MFITDGWPTAGRMSTSVFEAPQLTGPLEAGYVQERLWPAGPLREPPIKFISADGRRAWLCYSANLAPNWNKIPIAPDPPGSRYGLVLQEVLLPDPKQTRALAWRPASVRSACPEAFRRNKGDEVRPGYRSASSICMHRFMAGITSR